MIRNALPLIALLAATAVPAQSLEEMMNKAMQQQGDQNKVTVVENTDPFKPLTFTGSYRMEVHSFTDGKEVKDSPMNLRMAFRPDGMVMVPEANGQKASVRMVFDLKNKHTYTLVTEENGQRMGIKMKMMKVNVDGASEGSEAASKVTRTNETKVIEGRTCHKYTYSDNEGTGEAWVAEDLKWDMMTVLQEMLGGKKAEAWQLSGMDGMMLENTWTSADGKEKVVMYTKDLVVGKVVESDFSTAGYEIQDMSAMPMFGQ